MMIAINTLPGLDTVRRNWGWYMALGIALGVLGVFAICYSFLTTLVSVVVFGWVLIFSGIVEAIQAFRVRRWGGFFLHLLAAVLEIGVGALVIAKPLAGALGLTVLLAAYLIVGGVFRIIAALSLDFRGAGWLAVSGAISFILGLALAYYTPRAALWFIGLCVGVDLMMHGAAWFAFALMARRLPESELLAEGAWRGMEPEAWRERAGLPVEHAHKGY